MSTPQTVPAIDYRPPSIPREAYAFYREHFLLVFKLLAGPIGIALVIAWIVGEQIAKLMTDRFPFKPGSIDYRKLLQFQALTQFKFFTEWLCYCFAFAAICYAVQKVKSGEEPNPVDCNNIVRERPVRFLASALIMYLVVVLGFTAGMILMSGIITAQGRLRIPFPHYESLWLTLFMLVLISPVLVRFAFTVPVAVIEDLPIRSALRRSDRLSDWRIMVLMRLVLESEIAGYIAVNLPYWIANTSGWYGHPVVLYCLAIVLAGLAQAPMLIGMAVLLQQAKEDPRVAQPVLNRQIEGPYRHP